MDPTPLARRWLAFNLVGLAGIAVQLGTMAFLVRVLDIHYLAATVLAVQVAVLHNFAWHQHVTWRDRPAGSLRTAAERFVRFQFLNGTVSLVGNVLVTAVLTGAFDVDPLVANGAAILTCSLVNFAASESLVFRRAVPVAALAFSLALPAAAWAGPGASTLKAWSEHEASVDARYYAEGRPGSRFFAQDDGGDDKWRTRVVAGEITARRIDFPPSGDGRIHHWAGAVFIPGTTVAAVVERLKQAAGREADAYEDVIDSRLLARDGDRLRVYMRLRRSTIITATFNTEHAVEYRRLGPTRAASRSVATRIAEIADPGSPRERERTADDDRGFLWRLNAYWRFEQVDGGVIVECESVSLSRGVPALVRPVAGPLIEGVARESLEKTLREMRAMLAKPTSSE